MSILLAPLTIANADSAGTPGPVQKCVTPAPDHLTVEAIFTYGSGGTSVDAYLQTSLDGGTSWIDVANFHFTTASASKVINISSKTPITSAVTPSDGSLASNTVVDGIFGGRWRVKTKSAGTYAGGTTIAVYAFGTRLVAA